MRLEAAGIPAYVHDEHMVQLDWFMSNAIGGVRVQIADEDVELAREVLAADAARETPPESTVHCSACGSDKVRMEEWPRRLAFVTLLAMAIGLWPIALVSLILLTFNLPIQRHRWRCGSCDRLQDAAL